MIITDKVLVKSILPKRADDANKYTVGSLLCVCGSYSMAGAAVISAKAALRMGAGLVRCAVPRSIYPIVSAAVPEAVFMPLSENSQGAVDAKCMREIVTAANNSDSVLMGCGSKYCADTRSIALALMYHAEVPLILDADGINSAARHIDVLKERKHPTVLTPHEGEMSRLLSSTSAYVRGNRQAAAESFTEEHSAVLVLKGKDTLIASKNRETMKNPTGNSGMAVAGSGDVLAGMIASLAAQGADTYDAAVAGVYLHGVAGDIALSEYGEYSLLPSDIIESIPRALKQMMSEL